MSSATPMRDLRASSVLARLAERYGIEPEFRDARGVTVTTAPRTQELLLAAMGVKAESEAQAEVALDALDRAEWSRPVPAVAVIRADAGPASVEVTLPAGSAALAWHLRLEDGSERSGTASWASLHLLGERSLDGMRH